MKLREVAKMARSKSVELKYGGWGVVIGAVLTLIVGFSWGGWVTGGTAKSNSDDALLASRAAICAAQFADAPDRAQQIEAMQKVDSWRRADFISEGGWDKMPGQNQASSGVARACVNAIDWPASN